MTTFNVNTPIAQNTTVVSIENGHTKLKNRRNWESCYDLFEAKEKASGFANIQVAAEKGLQVFTFKQLHSVTGGFGKSNVKGHGEESFRMGGRFERQEKLRKHGLIFAIGDILHPSEGQYSMKDVIQFDSEKVLEIMDPALEGQYSMKDVIQIGAIAAMCVQPEADYRPLMADVVQSLVPLVKNHRPTPRIGSSSSFNVSQGLAGL
ncbi:hypothetical protein ACH5RR_028517 [Cinchona calisaya]|uniref:Uncharacterized protein n=1 Tax=Cinchona calisaya TaxID=153742 RepID=A0ABD2YQE2_9GENT